MIPADCSHCSISNCSRFSGVAGDDDMVDAEATHIPKQELLYCERFVELLTDMLSQVHCQHLPDSPGLLC